MQIQFKITKISGPFSDGSRHRGQIFEVTGESDDVMFPDMQMHVRLRDKTDNPEDNRFPQELKQGNFISVEV